MNVHNNQRCAGNLTLFGAMRSVHSALVGKTEGKKPLGRPRHKREDNIKVSIKAVCWGHGLDSSDSK